MKACVFIFCVCFCIFIADCFDYKSGNEYTRIKRAKYFSSSPFKFYNRPPFSPPIRGPFSYTPPPGYTANDVGPPTLNPRPYKVSKRPTNDGLGDEDLHNLFKYLSKKDLDKIVEFANEKERYSERYREMRNKNSYEPSTDIDINENLSQNDQMYENKRIVNSQNTRPNENRYYNSDNDSPNIRYQSNNEFNGPIQSHQAYTQIPIDTNDLKNEGQFSFLDAYIQKEIGNMSPEQSNIFTDSTTMQEERLPKPTNLRNDDHEISYTNDVVSVVKPETSYKLESFANLPLMGFENSKLHTVNSYSVPHYSVTSDHRSNKPSSLFSSPFSSSSSLSKPSSYNNIEVEPAPPVSTAKEQSDAHLKAIKIWTHRSKGTAYTLHDDGTLTLEQPSRPKFT